MIKLSKLLFGFSLLILVFSCGKDDDPVAGSSGLEGEWTAIEYSANIVTSTGGIQLATVTATGTSFNYDLNLDGSMFTTSGNYTANQTVNTAGFMQSSVVDYTDINGSGTYSVDGDVMTINGSFFDFEADGMDFSGVEDSPQTSTFEINSDGQLIFSQNETITDTQAGITVDAQITSTSTWVRK